MFVRETLNGRLCLFCAVLWKATGRTVCLLSCFSVRLVEKSVGRMRGVCPLQTKLCMSIFCVHPTIRKDTYHILLLIVQIGFRGGYSENKNSNKKTQIVLNLCKPQHKIRVQVPLLKRGLIVVSVMGGVLVNWVNFYDIIYVTVQNAVYNVVFWMSYLIWGTKRQALWLGTVGLLSLAPFRHSMV